MSTITKTVDDTLNLTIYSVHGLLGLDQIFELMDQFYQSQHTLNLVWDMSEADLSQISMEKIQAIQDRAKRYSHFRKNGKTAFIVPSDINFGIGRMYESMAEVNNHYITFEVFRSQEEAIKWMRE